MLVLTPTPIAQKCTLMEAIYWLALKKYPLAEPTENSLDRREDLEYQDDIVIHTYESNDTEVFVDEKVCKKYDLPRNYANEYFELNGSFPIFNLYEVESESEINKIISRQPPEAREAYRDEIKAGYDKQKEFDAKQEPFKLAFENFLEVPKAELFLALKKAEVLANGRLLKNEDDDFPSHTVIKSNKWSSLGINWEDSTLNYGDSKYVHVLIETDSLFSKFPPPEPIIQKVYDIEGTLLIDEEINSKLRKVSKIGRPSYNWKEFSEEMIRRFSANSLPPLQKICVIEMKEWCHDNWAMTPSDTNLKEHISPFYKVKNQDRKL